MAQEDSVRSTLGLKVLVVEDELVLAMELETNLLELGQQVIGLAGDAEEALSLANGTTPDVALVDLNLRDGLTGPQIARALVEQYGAVVVFVTATPGQIPSDYAGALGAITKPCDPATIAQLVRFIAAQRRGGGVPTAIEPPADLLFAPARSQGGEL